MTMSPGVQGRDQHLLDIGAEHLGVDRAVEHPGRVDPVVAQGGEESHGVPVPERRFGLHAGAAPSPTPQWGHVGLCPGLINEDKALRVNLSLILLPPYPSARHIGPILFTGQHAFF